MTPRFQRIRRPWKRPIRFTWQHHVRAGLAVIAFLAFVVAAWVRFFG